jgi:hypothetical protein
MGEITIPRVKAKPVTQTKKCTLCGKEKDLSAFNKLKHSNDGKKSECKECESERNKKNARKRKEDIWNYFPY